MKGYKTSKCIAAIRRWPAANRVAVSLSTTSASTKKQRSIIILGAPGSGKGTISTKILDKFDTIHVSTGDLLRDHIARSTALGKAAAGVMKAGLLVPDSTMFEVVETELVLHPVGAGRCVLFDGFPRTLAQAKEVYTRFHVDAVVSLCVPHQTVIDRISSRWVHLASGRTYSSDYHPEKRKGYDDETGEPLIQREDDKPASVAKRLELYEEMRKPLISFFQHEVADVVVRNFEGTQSDQIYPFIHSFLVDDVGLRPK